MAVDDTYCFEHCRRVLQRRATRTHTDESAAALGPAAVAGRMGRAGVRRYGTLLAANKGSAKGVCCFLALLQVALGLGYGLSQWLDRLHQPVQRRVAMAFAGILLVTTFYCALFVIRPIYALPEISAEIPRQPRLCIKNLGFGVELVAAELKPSRRILVTSFGSTYIGQHNSRRKPFRKSSSPFWPRKHVDRQIAELSRRWIISGKPVEKWASYPQPCRYPARWGCRCSDTGTRKRGVGRRRGHRRGAVDNSAEYVDKCG